MSDSTELVERLSRTMLEPCALKGACSVLRGGEDSTVLPLSDHVSTHHKKSKKGAERYEGTCSPSGIVVLCKHAHRVVEETALVLGNTP